MARRRRVDRQLRELRERKYRLRAKSTRFIPDADSDFAMMARHFAQHIAVHAERLSIPPERAADLNAAVEHFRGALSKTMRHDTAGPRATRLKNDARKKAESIVRDVAKVIRGSAEAALTAADRLTLNLPERAKRLKARQCPQVKPVLRFIGATHEAGRGSHGPPRHILEYGNDFDRASNAKPHGAARLELFVELVPVGMPMPSHPAQLSGGRLWYLRSYSTSRFEVEFPVLDDGTPAMVVYWGRWADARGGTGPFSQTCVARMEGGPEMPQLTHFGMMQKSLPGVRRKVEARQYALLEASVVSDAHRQLPAAMLTECKAMPLLESA